MYYGGFYTRIVLFRIICTNNSNYHSITVITIHGSRDIVKCPRTTKRVSCDSGKRVTELSVDEGEGEEENALIQQTFGRAGGLHELNRTIQEIGKDSIQRKQGMMDAIWQPWKEVE